MVDSVIRLFEGTAQFFTTNGLGYMTDAIECKVEEERNGAFELVMTYPITGVRYSELLLRRILVAKPNPYAKPQPFRIYQISKPINGKVTVNAEHISYDLSGYPVDIFTAKTVYEALNKLRSKCLVSCPFSFWTNKATQANFEMEKPDSIRSLLGGIEGSILDVYRGEYEFDNFEVKLWNSRGVNNGVSIRYGKNLTDLQQDENCANVFTGICPYWYTDEEGLVNSNPRIIPVPGTFAFTRIMMLNLSEEFIEKPTPQQLYNATVSYINERKIGVPIVSLTVSFINLADSEEYEEFRALETVKLCDEVTVEFPELGVAGTSRCIRTVYNVITDKYDSLELGDSRATLAQNIVDNKVEINKDLDTVNRNIRTIITIENGLIQTRIDDEVNQLNTTIVQTEREIRRDLEDGMNGLHTEIVETAAGIRVDMTDADRNLETLLQATAAGIRADMTDADRNLSNTIVATAEGIRTDMNAADQALSNSLTVTAEGIRADMTKSDEALRTSLQATANGLSAEVSRAKGAEGELTSVYQQLAGQIVMKATADGKIVTVALNADPIKGSEFKVKADNIKLSANELFSIMAGGTFDLTAKNIKINSDNFKVDEKGNVKCYSIEAFEIKGAAVDQFNNTLLNSSTMKRLEEILALFESRMNTVEELLTNDKVYFDTLDGIQYSWRGVNQQMEAVGGWSAQVDCSGYTKCIVRVKGEIKPGDSEGIAWHSYITLTFSNDPQTNNPATPAHHVVIADWGSSVENKVWGPAYNKWYNCVIDISQLTGVQTIKAFSWGSGAADSALLYISRLATSNQA